jgi:hypothetical protein
MMAILFFSREDGSSMFLRNVGIYLPTSPQGSTIQKNIHKSASGCGADDSLFGDKINAIKKNTKAIIRVHKGIISRPVDLYSCLASRKQGRMIIYHKEN